MHVLNRKTTGLLVLACSIAFAVGCAAPSMEATPFFGGDYKVAEGKPQDRINLWPLVYYRKPALSVLWPIGEYIPGERLLVWPLLEIAKLDREHRRYRVLSPLSELDVDAGTYWVFPVHWRPDEKRFVLFPLLWHLPGEFDGVFPVFWSTDEDDKWWTVFPLVWRAKDAYRIAFPFYMNFERTQGDSTHVLWPLFHVRPRPDDGESLGEYGWRLWPLYGHYSEGDAGRRYALWPLAMHLWDGASSARWIFPFYFAGRERERRWDLLLPVFYSSRSEKERKLGVFPFFYMSADPGGRTRWIAPAYYSRISAASRSTAVWPFFYRYWSERKKRLGVFPLFYASRGPDRSHLNVGMLLWDRRRGPAGDKWWGLAGLMGAGRDGQDSWHRALPLYAWERNGERRRLSVLLLSGWRGSPGRRASWVGPIYWDRSEQEQNWREGDSVWRTKLVRRAGGLWPLARFRTTRPMPGTREQISSTPEEAHINVGKQRRPTASTNWYLFPLASYSGHRRTDGKDVLSRFELLWRLADYRHRVKQREGEREELDEQTRFRLLWRLVHYERLNGTVALDVVPGITYDHTPGRSRSFSFLWRVFRYEWDSEKGRKFHVLFCPL